MSGEQRIPMIDLVAQHAEIEEELREAFAEVLASGRFILGAPVQTFETELAKLCDAREAVSCNSGTDALWLALRGLDIGVGDSVLCPAYSFFATAATIVRVGATPVFVDINPATLNMDPIDAIRRAEGLTNLRGVITADLFGQICELGPLEAYCAERNIPIIEDAAQSIGAVDSGGKQVGERTRIACFSFYPTKNLGALGDAGGLVTGDSTLSKRIAGLRIHGEEQLGVYQELGINSRMDALQAAALSAKLRHLERWTRARRDRALHYDALFYDRGAPSAETPLGEPGLPLRTPPPLGAPGRHTYHRYIVRVPKEKRTSLISGLHEKGIASEIYYPRGLHQQPALSAFAPSESLPETERAAEETLALPLYPELELDQIERVVDSVCEILKRP